MTLLPEFRSQIHAAAVRRAGRSRYLPMPGWWRGAWTAGVTKTLPVVASVAVVAGVALGALLTLNRGAKTGRSAPTEQVAARPSWLLALGTRFAVLRGPGSPPTLAVSNVLVHLGIRHADLRFVHRVTLPAGTIWVAPEQSQICLAFAPVGEHQPIGATCQAVARTWRSGVGMSAGRRVHPGQPITTDNPLRSWNVGLVPDGTSTVRLRVSTGAVVRARVEQNTFAITTAPSAREKGR
jgi:hypothetical protein